MGSPLSLRIRWWCTIDRRDPERPWEGSATPDQTGSAVVGELHREVVVLLLDQRLHGLQVVALLGRDAELVALDLRLDALGALVADQLGDLLGVLGGDALLERDRDLALLPGLAGLARVEDLQRLLPLDELALEDVEHRRGAVVGARGDLDRLVPLPLDGGAGALEVEARGDLPCGLSQCVVDLLAVDLADDVERRVGHVCPLCVPLRKGATAFSRVMWCCAIVSPCCHRAKPGVRHGRLPERPMGADCKSVGVFLRRFESCTCHTTLGAA